MPSPEKHCKKSIERTGKDYRELHQWMDEGSKYLGENHRFERHSNAYIDYVYSKWGVEGVIEFLHHIIDDFKTTLKTYEFISDLDETKQFFYIELRELRAKIVRRDRTSWNGVFSNEILKEMAIKQPHSIDAMKKIRGIHPDKVEKYGKEFVSFINSFYQ